MNKKKNVLNRISQVFSYCFLFTTLLFSAGCNNNSGEPEPKIFTMPGIYTFDEATLQTEVSMILNLGSGNLPVNLPVGTDITDQLSGGLLNEAPCDNPENAAVELKENKELFFTCNGESNELKAGTWEHKEVEKILNLNLASPPLPFAIPLKIENVIIDEKNETISGTIVGFPLTPDLMMSFVPSFLTSSMTPQELAALKAQFPPLFQVDIDVKFKKIE